MALVHISKGEDAHRSEREKCIQQWCSLFIWMLRVLLPRRARDNRTETCLSVCLSVCRPFLFCTDATEPEMRWQISMSLAYGARGILYFYWTQNVHKVAKDGPEWPGLVSGDG